MTSGRTPWRAAPDARHAVDTCVRVSLLLAPLCHAALLTASGMSPWPTLVALGAGLVAGRRWPVTTGPVLLGAGPLVPLAMYLAAGSHDIQHAMPWLAAVSAWLVASDLGQPELALPRSWAWALRTWQLTVALAWPVVAARELDFTSATIGAATGNGLAGGSPQDTAALTILAAAGTLTALRLFTRLLTAPPQHVTALLSAVAPGLLASAAVALYQGVVDLAWLGVNPWVRLGRAGGALFDANSSGGLLAIMGPTLGAVLFHRIAGRRGAVVSAVMTLVVLPAVLATASRTALLAWALGAAGLGTAVIRRVVTGRGARLATAAGLVLIAAALVTGDTVRRGASSAVGRMVRTEQGSNLFVGLLFGRDGYGPAAMQAVHEHAWTGLGVGAFPSLVGGYAVETLGHSLPPDNAQAWWRQVLVDYGLLGSLAPLLAMLWLMRASWGAVREHGPAHAGVLAAFGLMSVVSLPTQHPVVHMLYAAVLAWSVSRPTAEAADQDGRPDAATTGWANATSWLVAGACASGLAWSGVHELRPATRAERFGFQYGYGYADTEEPGSAPSTYRRGIDPHVVVVVPTGGAPLGLRIDLPADPGTPDTASVEATDGHGGTCRGRVTRAQPFECRLGGGRQWSRLEMTVRPDGDTVPSPRPYRTAIATLTVAQTR